MCGRFVQYEARSDYLAALNSPLACQAAETDIPIGRYNISPGSRVLLLHRRDAELHLDAVTWGYHPQWAKENHQPAMVSTRSQTAPYSRLFKPLWRRGRALIPADGWYEWRTDPRHTTRKQPYFIYHIARRPLFFAAIGRFDSASPADHDGDGVVLLTGPGERGPVDTHSRPPLVFTGESARQWLDPALDRDDAYALAEGSALPPTAFVWHPVSSAVGNIYNDSAQLIRPITDPVI